MACCSFGDQGLGVFRAGADDHLALEAQQRQIARENEKQANEAYERSQKRLGQMEKANESLRREIDRRINSDGQ